MIAGPVVPRCDTALKRQGAQDRLLPCIVKKMGADDVGSHVRDLVAIDTFDEDACVLQVLDNPSSNCLTATKTFEQIISILPANSAPLGASSRQPEARLVQLAEA